MTRDEVLRDLRETYGRKLVLSPADIAEAIGHSPKTQANMRYNKTFPLPIKAVGGRIGVSVYALAEYLAGDAPEARPVGTRRASVSAPPSTASRNKTTQSSAAKPAHLSESAPVPPKAWAPSRSKKSLAPAIRDLRKTLDFWSAVHAELEALELARFVAKPSSGAKQSDTTTAQAGLRLKASTKRAAVL